MFWTLLAIGVTIASLIVSILAVKVLGRAKADDEAFGHKE